MRSISSSVRRPSASLAAMIRLVVSSTSPKRSLSWGVTPTGPGRGPPKLADGQGSPPHLPTCEEAQPRGRTKDVRKDSPHRGGNLAPGPPAGPPPPGGGPPP